MKKFRWDKQYLYWGITALSVIVCCIAFYWILQSWPELKSTISMIIRILSPFIWGLVIAYLLNPMMRWFEKIAFLPLAVRMFKKRAKLAFKLARAFSIICALLIASAVIASLMWLIIPRLYVSIESLVINAQSYVNQLIRWAEDLLENYPQVEEFIVPLVGNVSTSLIDWARGSVLPEMSSLVGSVSSGVYNAIRTVFNILIGIVVSCYVLYNQEVFGAHIKKTIYSIFSVKRAEKLLKTISFTDKVLMGFIGGKILDSLIIAGICYICCTILKMPYALLVSVIIGITNIIPFFGPFIGAVPAALIILMVSPIKCLIFVIFIILLQQFDGNILGPKILGGTTGLNGFWVMFSIILGAGLFGFAGMLLGVPVFTVIYASVRTIINGRLKDRGLPSDTEEYKNLDHIDPCSGAPVRKDSQEIISDEKVSEEP